MIDQVMTDQSQVSDSDRTWRRRRRIGIAMITAGGVLLLAGLWLAVTALMARSQLNQVRAEAHTLGAQLSASNWPAARATAADLADPRASRQPADLRAGVGPGRRPALGRRATANHPRHHRGVDALGRDALPQLVSASERLNPRTLRRPDGSIDLARIAAVAPAINSASASRGPDHQDHQRSCRGTPG